MSVSNKIKKIVNPTEEEKYQKQLKKFREQHIPERYNQVKLLEQLSNKEIDHYISISNRTDGKSFNYIHTLINICIKYDLGMFMLSRNMMLRSSYMSVIENVIEESETLERRDFVFISQQYFIKVIYKERDFMVISDMNQATQLKYYSNYIKQFPIIVYDEFLALEGDYLSDEWERLKTIYESIDRQPHYNLIGKPKIFYLGNAVNFSSPILSNLDLFNKIENHPINNMKQYGNVILEINRNDNANDERNTRAFNSEQDAMTTAQFEVNKHQLVTENVRRHVNKNRARITVKLYQEYLIIDYNRDDFKTILSVTGFTEEEYNYNTMLKDNKEESTYLDDGYYKENETKRHDKGVYYYENQYTKEQITNGGQGIVTLNIRKLIREHEKELNKKPITDIRDEQYERNYIDDSIKSLYNKFFR